MNLDRGERHIALWREMLNMQPSPYSQVKVLKAELTENKLKKVK